MKHIIDDKADIVNLNNEELYLAGRLYNLEPFAMEQYNGGESFDTFGSSSSPSLGSSNLASARHHLRPVFWPEGEFPFPALQLSV